MLFSFSPMAFGDVAWFSFDFARQLTVGDFITGTPTVTATPGAVINPMSITVVGSPLSKVICEATAGRAEADVVVSCTIITNGGVISTRSAVIPVSNLVPS